MRESCGKTKRVKNNPTTPDRSDRGRTCGGQIGLGRRGERQQLAISAHHADRPVDLSPSALRRLDELRRQLPEKSVGEIVSDALTDRPIPETPQ